jgi:hypothetical protein
MTQLHFSDHGHIVEKPKKNTTLTLAAGAGVRHLPQLDRVNAAARDLAAGEGAVRVACEARWRFCSFPGCRLVPTQFLNLASF